MDRRLREVVWRPQRNGLFALVLWAAGASPSAAGATPDAHEEAVVLLRGRVVCIDKSAGVRPCVVESRRFALRTVEGVLHVFPSQDTLAGIFEDDSVRERELLVRARRTPSGGIETIKVYSTRNGTIYDLDYFCEVCNITAYAPGPCVCCGQPLRLRETPVP